MSDLTGEGTEPRPSTPAAPQQRGGRGARRRTTSALREFGLVLGTALVLSLLIKTFLAQAFFIPSESMEPTLVEGDRVLVTRLAPGPLDLHRGDVVVFVDPGGWLGTQAQDATPVQRALEFIGLLPQNTGEHLIKRIVGMPGDRVVCCDADGLITVNGEPIRESYVMPGAEPSRDEFDRSVPADHLFVLGDNRAHSGDSRYNLGAPGGGMVPMSNVVGIAQLRMWPLDRFALLRNPGEVFRDVPAADG